MKNYLTHIVHDFISQGSFREKDKINIGTV